jgi:hypothetical protein
MDMFLNHVFGGLKMLKRKEGMRKRTNADLYDKSAE